ncbi:hypothetical protein [Chrysiogenes arsenatis]|uniref:hypothetical protein n=1 Tax=Chrysiogenes arsenatis TaxID=309797 RepID=UPI0003FB4D99|nr:hypothetical protein [Chrysiogenes arsenatis]
MTITDLPYTAQVIAPDGRTWFFHDVGGVPLWLEDKPFRDTARIWTYSEGTWIDARTAWFARNEVTPMEYGFGGYREAGEGRVEYETMRQLMLRGENMTNPAVKRKLFIEDCH